MYRPTKSPTTEPAYNQIPCSICPVFAECSDEGDITPAKCPYLTNWLNF